MRPAENDAPTEWPICTRHVGQPVKHVGNEDYGIGSPAWKYVGKHGDATCSCCDPVAGFPCITPPGTGDPS